MKVSQILNSDAPLFIPDMQAQSPSSVLKQTVGPSPAFVSDPVGLGQSLRICSSHLLQVVLLLWGQGLHFENRFQLNIFSAQSINQPLSVGH